MQNDDERNDAGDEIGDAPALATAEQVSVPFLDDILLALLGTDGEIYVPITPLATRLGMAQPRRQVARIRRDETMTEALRKMPLATAGGPQELQCLRIDMVTLWLATVRESMVRESVRPILMRYKREAARAILAHFAQRAQLRTADAALPMPMPGAALAEWHAWHLAMAEMYATLDAQRATLAQHTTRLDRLDREVAGISDDLTGIKEALAIIGEAPPARISAHQASEIQQLVGTIHEHTGQHQKTIYGAFNKQWHIPRYDELPADRFDAALDWLRQWGRAWLSRK